MAHGWPHHALNLCVACDMMAIVNIVIVLAMTDGDGRVTGDISVAFWETNPKCHQSIIKMLVADKLNEHLDPCPLPCPIPMSSSSPMSILHSMYHPRLQKKIILPRFVYSQFSLSLYAKCKCTDGMSYTFLQSSFYIFLNLCWYFTQNVVDENGVLLRACVW